MKTHTKKDELWSRAKLKELLGVSDFAVTKMVRQSNDPLPVLMFGRRQYFEPGAVLAWMGRRGKRHVRQQA